MLLSSDAIHHAPDRDALRAIITTIMALLCVFLGSSNKYFSQSRASARSRDATIDLIKSPPRKPVYRVINVSVFSLSLSSLGAYSS